MVTKRGKRGDRPCQSPRRGRLSADERLQVEELLEHVVYRLEGKGSDRFVSFSSMLRHGVTMETVASALMLRRGGARRMFGEDVQEACWHYWEIGRGNPDVAQIAETSGRKLRHADVFGYYRRELAALDPPIDTPAAFESALRARTNRISRKKSH